jgi:hypothetical protein
MLDFLLRYSKSGYKTLVTNFKHMMRALKS